MKKIYKNPTLTVIEFESSCILAGSFEEQLGDDGVDGSISLSSEEIFIDWQE